MSRTDTIAILFLNRTSILTYLSYHVSSGDEFDKNLHFSSSGAKHCSSISPSLYNFVLTIVLCILLKIYNIEFGVTYLKSISNIFLHIKIFLSNDGQFNLYLHLCFLLFFSL